MSKSPAAAAAAAAAAEPLNKKQKTQHAAMEDTAAHVAGSDDDDGDEAMTGDVEVVAGSSSSSSDSSDSDSDSGSDSDSDSDSSSSASSVAAASSSAAASAAQTRVLQFRNYKPHDATLRVSQVAPLDLQKDNDWMDKELQEIIDGALRNENDDSVLLSVTPKPLNWDLRRDLAPKLQQLAAKTTSTIRSLLQTQIDAQKANEADDSSSSDDSDSESSSSEEEEEGKK